MSAQYDAIAAQYARTRESPLRRWVEEPSFMALAGEVRGMRVLDLGCGDGYYSRALRTAGAREVVGVDISPAMIARARQAESAQPQGIVYHCADAAELPALGTFDCVTAAYLLHYAPDRRALAAMAAGIGRCLLPGGRFVTLNENPAQPGEVAGCYAQYGFSKKLVGAAEDGAVIRYRMIAGRESFAFNVRYYRRETYEAVLAAAGLRDIAWHPLVLAPGGCAAVGCGYFTAYLEQPPVIGLSGVRAP